MNLLEARIDLDAIAHNTRLIKDKAAAQGAQLMCVVKADGYNHGAVEVATAMEENGADQFGVATIREALALREGGIESSILSWIWSPEQDLGAAIAAGIDLAAISLAHVKALVRASESYGENLVRVTVKVDTGLHRSGVDKQDWEEAFCALRDAENIQVTGVFSHFSSADESDSPETEQQVEAFLAAIELGRSLGLELPVNHIANSPATLNRPDLYFDMVRPGLALYGHEPIPGENHGLREAMSWVGRVTVVKPIAKGEGTSYNLTWRAEQGGYLCVVPVGYADGLPRSAQGHLEVTIGGRRYPQVGRVCMDQIVVSLGGNPHGVAQGDEAVILGPTGMTATELATAIGTINYELVCRPCGRTVRVFEHRD